MASPPEPAAEAPLPSAAPSHHVYIEAIQTVTPMKATEAGIARRIVSASTVSGPALAAHLRVVFYYRRAREEDYVWAVAGWIKESLNVALLDQPLLAGRLRRRDDGEGLEVKLNDAGVRLVQAQVDLTMAEFLAADDREAKEANLAHWVDIDRENPQFSAPFYVQVTRFEQDGYAVGISCSLLLADPLFVSRFLRTWSGIHGTMHAENRFSENSIFHLSSFKRSGMPAFLRSVPMDSICGRTYSTVLFAGGSTGEAAAASVEEAARMAEEEMEPATEVLLIAAGADRLEDLNVGMCRVRELPASGGSSGKPPSAVDWGLLHGNDVALGEGNKPVQVSGHIVAGGERPLVVVMPPLEEGGQGLTSVTFPKKA